jgi:vancomycin permeability regulator SanA
MRDSTSPSRRGALLRLGLLLIAIAPLAPVVTSAYVAAKTHRLRYDRVESVPSAPVAIVFGAGVRPDGRLSRMLAERVQAAVALYHEGRVEKLLMTGDNSSIYYDEVSAMRRYAIERGVEPADITLDHAGFSTYDSCYRAGAIFGVERAVLVTQRYHLPRAVYTCRRLGVDAVGLGTRDWGAYHPALLTRYAVREALATGRALVQVHVTRPLPTFLGPFEGIS